MSVKISYKEDHGLSGRQLRIEGGLDEAAIRAIESGDFDVLWLKSGNFSGMAEVACLPSIKKLRMTSDVSQDISWIDRAESLEVLVLTGKLKGSLDFSGLRQLERCEIDYHKSTSSIFESRCPLESLFAYKVPQGGIRFSSELIKSLRTFGLMKGSLESLAGIEQLGNVEVVSLIDLKKLKDVSDLLSIPRLERLTISGCNEIEGLEFLKGMNSLQEVCIENKLISSLDIMPANIRKIILGRSTVISDRNVASALNLPSLERFVFYPNKDYQYDAEQLAALLSDRS